MRTDPKQQRQEQIVELLQKIDPDYNWFGIAGRLLKTFDCELICFALKELTNETNQNIKSMTPNANNIMPYLYKIVKSWEPEYCSWKQKEEDGKVAKLLDKTFGDIGVVKSLDSGWRIESQKKLKFLRQKLELVYGEKREEIKREIERIKNKLENIKD